jgi:hypothetical protein
MLLHLLEEAGHDGAGEPDCGPYEEEIVVVL